jgi:hypothetical protein
MKIQHLRASERATFADCQWRWWMSWREGLVPRTQVATPLWFGTIAHAALAAWYCGPGTLRGPFPVETWDKLAGESLRSIKFLNESDEAEYVSGQELGHVLMEEYIKFHGDDAHMLVISPEWSGQLDIPWPKDQALYDVRAGEMLVRYAWTMDLVWRHADTGWIWMEEHKTASSISTAHLRMDNQAGSYWATAQRTLRERGLIGLNDRVHGIEYNFIRKAMPDPRPRDDEGYCTNKDGTRSKVQPKPLFERHMVHRSSAERASQLRRIQDEALHMRAVRDGLLPVTKRPDRRCGWCQFKTMCELHEASGNWEEFKRLQFRVEDPYASHRKSTEEGTS